MKISIQKLLIGILLVMPMSAGCGAAYLGVVKPQPGLEALAPELKEFSDAKIEQYLAVDVKPVFPTVLAVARLGATRDRYHGRYVYDRSDGTTTLAAIQSDEAAGWRKLSEPESATGKEVVSQVQFVNPMLASSVPTLKELRNAAAMLHARTVIVYRQEDSTDEGRNSAAMAYWTIIGLFIVPGHTVGHYSVCQGLIMDTRTGLILATVQGESKKEENVLPGAVGIARERTEKQARAEAVAHMQEDAARALLDLAHRSPIRRAATR